MRIPAALFLALLAAQGWGATAYVTDELVLGVYADQSTEGQRLSTLHSGADVETLIVRGDATQVRLNDGTIGWVKTAYLTASEPAIVRVKRLQDELDRSHQRISGQSDPDAATAGERLPKTDSGQILQTRPWLWGAAVIIALAGGFWLGYAVLARRIKYKFGGIKVY